MYYRVAIGNEDKCDACGQCDRIGVSFGFNKPVICVDCLEAAVDTASNGNAPVELSERLQRMLGVVMTATKTRH